MKTIIIPAMCLAGLLSVTTTASAQHYSHYHNQYTPSHGHNHVQNGYTYNAQSSYYLPPQLQNISFGAFSHVDELANRLELLSNELCLDLYYNYSHNPGFDETYREAYEILEVARYIHAAEHHHDRDAIASRLQGLDDLFHHVEDDVSGWSRYHRRQVGNLGILTKMELMESSLHHLMKDVGVKLSPGIQQAPTPDQILAPQQAPPPLPPSPTAMKY